MVVLVTYASAHGSTQGIAERIAARLEWRGMRAKVRPVEEVDAIDEYDAIVAGSSIHDGKWLPDAVDFLELHAAELATKPVFLFSVSLVGETSSAFPEGVARQLRATLRHSKRGMPQTALKNVADHRWFAGAIERHHWPGAPGRTFFKMMRGRYGDHRDWPDVDAWADRIAQDLGSPTRH